MKIRFNKDNKNIIKFCSRDEFRPALCGVHVFRNDAEDKWYGIATDSYKLIKIPVEFIEEDYYFAEEVIIPVSILEHHFRHLPKDAVCYIQIEPDSISSHAGNQVITERPIKEQFPPANEMLTNMKSHDDYITIDLNTSHLGAVCSFLKDAVAEMDISPDNNGLVFNIGDEVSGIIMPVKKQHYTDFLGKNLRVDYRIKEFKQDIEKKIDYVLSIFDTDAIKRTKESIHQLRGEIIEAHSQHVLKENPFDITLKFSLDDISELGYDTFDYTDEDIVYIIDILKDKLSEAYNNHLSAILLEYKPTPRPIPEIEGKNDYIDDSVEDKMPFDKQIEELSYSDLEDWVNEIESIPEEERTSGQKSDRLYYLGLMNDIENGVDYEQDHNDYEQHDEEYFEEELEDVEV